MLRQEVDGASKRENAVVAADFRGAQALHQRAHCRSSRRRQHFGRRNLRCHASLDSRSLEGRGEETLGLHFSGDSAQENDFVAFSAKDAQHPSILQLINPCFRRMNSASYFKNVPAPERGERLADHWDSLSTPHFKSAAHVPGALLGSQPALHPRSVSEDERGARPACAAHPGYARRSDQLDASCFEPVEPEARAQALSIVEAVKSGGEAALLEHAWRFRDLKEGDAKFLLSAADLEQAFTSCDKDLQEMLLRTAARVRRFAEAQRSSITPIEVDIAGGKAGQTVAPVKSAGCYAPGGRYPLPSSVLMTAVTARAAGVEKVVVASPRPSPVTMAAAHVAGADALLAVGGAQAIAALAYGVGEGVPACDIIVGPGNKWVTAAKSIVSGVCGIDMLAGPSEVLVIADDTADAAVVAADLLAQAEHDVEARPILVTHEQSVIDKVNEELAKQLAVLTTNEGEGSG
eukprot:scaffold75_cov217-Pinguiococcus_pyrenoidosus.AAC.10